MKVLLVEDDLNIAKSLETALNNQGFTVDAVTTGEAALFLVANTEIDVVILDIGLPDIDGLSVLRKVREKWKALPVIKKYAAG
jgi:DNA-binding response OmpR family regulator